MAYLFKAVDLSDAYKIKNEKIKIKLTVKTGQVMFIEERYYYLLINSSEKVDNIIGKRYYRNSRYVDKCQRQKSEWCVFKAKNGENM